MKIYPYLRLLWLSLTISTLAMVGLVSNNETVLIATDLVNLFAFGLILFALYRLSNESVRFSRAFICTLFAFVLSLLSFILFLIDKTNFFYFSSLLLITGSFFNLLGDYHMYWALDERIIPHGYVYPARRIRLCFYLPLLAAFFGSFFMVLNQAMLPGIVMEVAAQIAQLVLFFQYIMAVRNREFNPLSM